TSGGGITVFSAQLLDRSDFSTGAMPAEYGNAISGAMDVHFRRGNMEEREYRVKIGLLGLDFATEGPIQKGRMSYLVNYRFSTLSLLNDLGFNLVGERVDNDFQDLSFNLARESRDGKGRWTFFGMGGLSQEHYRPVADPTAREAGRADHWEDRYQGSNMLAGGLTFTRTLDDNSYIKWVVSGMGSRIYRDFDTLNLDDTRYTYNTEQYLDRRLATSFSYSRKLNTRTRIKTGLQIHQIWFEFLRESAPRRLTDITGVQVERDLSIQGMGQTQTLQAYAQSSFQLNPKLTLNGGLHAFALMLNQTGVIEPRLSMRYQPTRRQSISMAYGLHGQHLPLGAYFYDDSTGNNPNFNLPMIRSHHSIFGYQLLLGKGLRLGVEGYVQRLFNVPVRADEAGIDNTWWMLNNQAGIAQFPLSQDGKGLNYGVDLVAEKFFSKGLYFLLTFSRFESKMELADGRIFDTRFGTKFSSSYTLGKEFTFRNQSTLQIGARFLYNGGFRYTPPNAEASVDAGAFVADNTRLWGDQVNPYNRIDARIAYRFNRPRYAGLISLDIQNVTDRRNPRGITWNSDTRMINLRNHPSGLIPVLSFQSDF
ncbi:MAG: TonB-dependent receptor, partial [Bacteroidota bacterium]